MIRCGFTHVCVDRDTRSFIHSADLTLLFLGKFSKFSNSETLNIWTLYTHYYMYWRNISLRFSRNSKAPASELLENLEEMLVSSFLIVMCVLWTNLCTEFIIQISPVTKWLNFTRMCDIRTINHHINNISNLVRYS